MAQLQIPDFLEPIGQLNPDVIWPGRRKWPRSRIESTVEEYRKQGYLLTAAVTDQDKQDDLVRLWVNYRAWSSLYDRLSGGPAGVGSNLEGSSQYTQEQIDSWNTRAQDALAEYEALLDGATASPVAGLSSRSVETQFRF